MGQFLDHLAADKAGASLDRVHGAEQPIDAFGIRHARPLFQRQQILHHVGQMFLGLAHELVDRRLGNRRGGSGRTDRGLRGSHRALSDRRPAAAHGRNLGDQLFECARRQAAVALGRVCRCPQPAQRIDAPQQHVHAVAGERDLPALGGDETILQLMGHLDRGLETDDLRRALDRVGCAHQGFELLGIPRRLLQGEHPGAEGRQMGLEFGAKQVQQRRIGRRSVGHAETTARGVTGKTHVYYSCGLGVCAFPPGIQVAVVPDLGAVMTRHGNHETDGKNDGNGMHDSHSSHDSHSLPPTERLLPPRGDYQTLLSFQKAEVILRHHLSFCSQASGQKRSHD